MFEFSALSQIVELTPNLSLANGVRLPIDEAIALAQQNMQTLGRIWLVSSIALVFLMQAGFLLLEAGASRSKNSINVAQKNLVDFALAGFMFYLVGYSLMFGPSLGGMIGSFNGLPHPTDDATLHVFLFQLVFCGTAATIVSGAIAERMTFHGYLVLTLLISVIIYPIFGHWAWGAAIDPDNPALLAAQGFIDFVGGTVVHSVGGWVALAAIIVLGPRIGKFTTDGQPRQIVGHSAVLSALGCLLLWIGWIGFNGGSLSPSDPQFGKTVTNTIVAGLVGGIAAQTAGRIRDGHFRPDRLVNGVLGGLVGVTAGANLFSTLDAVLIGGLSGLIVMLGVWLIEQKFKLDDVVGAVAVHGFCGAFGTIAVGILGNPEGFVQGSRFAQTMVQIQGVLICAVWSFGVGFFGLKLVERYIPLRVSPADEERGLNIAEHGWSLGAGKLIRELGEWNFGEPAALQRRLDDKSGDEAGEIGRQINRIMAERDRQEQSLLHDALHDPLTGLMNRHGLAGMAVKAMRDIDAGKAAYAVIAVDLDGFKPINDTHGHSTGDQALIEVAERFAGCLRASDTLARIGGDEFVALVKINSSAAGSAEDWAERLLGALQSKILCDGIEIQLGASIGVVIVPDDADTIDDAMKIADENLYSAKRAGRNRVCSSRLPAEADA